MDRAAKAPRPTPKAPEETEKDKKRTPLEDNRDRTNLSTPEAQPTETGTPEGSKETAKETAASGTTDREPEKPTAEAGENQEDNERLEEAEEAELPTPLEGLTPKQRNRRPPTRKEEEENRPNLTKQGIETEKPSETGRIRQNGIAKVLVSFEANQRAEGEESKTQQQTQPE